MLQSLMLLPEAHILMGGWQTQVYKLRKKFRFKNLSVLEVNRQNNWSG